jgi:hypothetical protein
MAIFANTKFCESLSKDLKVIGEICYCLINIEIDVIIENCFREFLKVHLNPSKDPH